jgi:hypothetical protein
MNKIITTALGIAAAAAGLYAFNSQIGDNSKLGEPAIVGKNLCYDYDGNGRIDVVTSRSYGNPIYLYNPSEVSLKDLKGKVNFRINATTMSKEQADELTELAKDTKL